MKSAAAFCGGANLILALWNYADGNDGLVVVNLVAAMLCGFSWFVFHKTGDYA